MEALELVLLLLAAVLVSAVIDQLVPKLSSPLIQIAFGVCIAAIASSQIDIPFDPDLFLVLFVAPLLYDEAREANKAELLRYLRPELALAIGLVIVTVLAVGLSVNWLIPSIPIAAAFALGAALGPTDAIAVSSLPKDINIGERRTNILKGEYLINDASGIVAFQFAVAAVTTGAFHIGDAALEFLVVFFGGIIVGILGGIIGNLIEKFVRNLGLENTTFHVLFDICLPFIIYLVAEPLGASGIIAVVLGGLVRSYAHDDIAPSYSRQNIVSSSTWRVLSFTLNGIVFVLLGTQLPRAMETMWDDITISNFELVLYIVLITFVVMGVRFLWIFASELINKQYSDPTARKRSAGNSALIMTLAGPKGAVTLSIVLAIPLTLMTGSPFPQRNLIIFIACGVILLTLLMSNFLLPRFAPKKNIAEEQIAQKQRDTEAAIEIFRRVIEELSARQTSENRRATQEVIRSYNDRIMKLKDNIETEDDNASTELQLKILDVERKYVTELIQSGKVSPSVGYAYLNRIAITKKLLEHHESTFSYRMAIIHVYDDIKNSVRNVVNQIPGSNLSEQGDAVRALHAQSVDYVIEYLQKELVKDSTVTEDVTKLLLKYQQTQRRLKSTLPSMTTIVRSTKKREDVTRLGLTLELEGIQEAYDEGRLSRAAAKRMRENVHMMNLDAEDHV